MSSIDLFQTMRRDVTYSLRILRAKPAFSITAVITLALAIGGNTAMFSVIRAVLLNPLPYPDSDQLVSISGGATPSRFAELKSSARCFTGIGAFTSEETPTFSGQGEPEVLKAVRVSAGFLRLLGVAPLRGREFSESEDSAGRALVVMISAELWQRRFAGHPDVTGKTAVLGGSTYTIVGVLPARFSFPFPHTDVWMTGPQDWPVIAPKSRAASPFLTLFGRLKPGISVAQATAEAKLIQQRYASAHPEMLDAKLKQPEKVTPLKDDLVRDVRSMLCILYVAVGYVLFII